MSPLSTAASGLGVWRQVVCILVIGGMVAPVLLPIFHWLSSVIILSCLSIRLLFDVAQQEWLLFHYRSDTTQYNRYFRIQSAIPEMLDPYPQQDVLLPVGVPVFLGLLVLF
jgi:hypothetical protein